MRALTATLKRKCLHFGEIFITGYTGRCQNFQCSQWWKFRQNDDIFVSVNDGLNIIYNMTQGWPTETLSRWPGSVFYLRLAISQPRKKDVTYVTSFFNMQRLFSLAETFMHHMPRIMNTRCTRSISVSLSPSLPPSPSLITYIIE